MGARAAGTRREFRGAVVVLAAVLVASLGAGAVWGLLVPTELVLVVEPGRGAPLVGESRHRFDALAIFAGLGMVTGLLSAVAAWRWRRMRGPIPCAGLLLGSMVGALLMLGSGENVNAWKNPRPAAPPVGEIATIPVVLESPLVLVLQPLTAALVMVLLAGLSMSEDLGSGFLSPFGESRPLPGIDADGAAADYPPESGDRVPAGGPLESVSPGEAGWWSPPEPPPSAPGPKPPA